MLALRVGPPPAGTGVALLGVVDTGADMTLIPEAVARSLALPVVSRIRLAGITGSAESADVMAAAIELAGARFLAEVVAFGDEAILGRDFLRHLVLRLDGPRGALQVGTVRSRQKARPRSTPAKGRKKRS